jgi:hypothetical protein
MVDKFDLIRYSVVSVSTLYAWCCQCAIFTVFQLLPSGSPPPLIENWGEVFDCWFCQWRRLQWPNIGIKGFEAAEETVCIHMISVLFSHVNPLWFHCFIVCPAFDRLGDDHANGLLLWSINDSTGSLTFWNYFIIDTVQRINRLARLGVSVVVTVPWLPLLIERHSANLTLLLQCYRCTWLVSTMSESMYYIFCPSNYFRLDPVSQYSRQ